MRTVQTRCFYLVVPRETVKMDKDNVEPPQPKKKRLSFSRRKNDNPDRFVTVSKDSLEEMSTMKMPIPVWIVILPS